MNAHEISNALVIRLSEKGLTTTGVDHVCS